MLFFPSPVQQSTYSNFLGHCLRIRMAGKKQQLKIPSAGRDMEQLKLLHCWWGWKMAQPLWKTLSYKIKHIFTTWPSNLTLRYLLKSMKIWVCTSQGFPGIRDGGKQWPWKSTGKFLGVIEHFFILIALVVT